MIDAIKIFDFLSHIGIIFLALIVLWGLFKGADHDDSDPPNGRSGVAVVTDAKTGLQYLKAPGGGITPRLDKDGRQMRMGE